MFLLVGCSDAEPHEMNEVEQQAWAMDMLEKYYEIESDRAWVIDTGLDNAPGYCAAMTRYEEEGFDSMAAMWADSEDVLADSPNVSNWEEIEATMHIGYAVACPDVYEEYLEWREFD